MIHNDSIHGKYVVSDKDGMWHKICKVYRETDNRFQGLCLCGKKIRQFKYPEYIQDIPPKGSDICNVAKQKGVTVITEFDS